MKTNWGFKHFKHLYTKLLTDNECNNSYFIVEILPSSLYRYIEINPQSCRCTLQKRPQYVGYRFPVFSIANSVVQLVRDNG